MGDGLTTVYCANTGQTNTFQGMGFHYRFSRGDRVQIISGKHKGATGTVDANVFQRSVDFPKDHLPCHHVLLDNHLVITIKEHLFMKCNSVVMLKVICSILNIMMHQRMGC